MTSHDEGLRTSKPSSPLEESDSRILRDYCGVKEFSGLGPLHTEPKAHAEEEEMSKVEQRRSKLLGDVTEDNHVLGEPRPRKEKVPHP